MFSSLVRVSQNEARRQIAIDNKSRCRTQSSITGDRQSEQLVSRTRRHSERSVFSIVVLWLAMATAALAQPLIEEEQRLSFGTLAVAANTSVSRYTYSGTGNNIAIEGQFVLIARGTPGRYRLTGFPAASRLSISLDNTTLSADGIGITEQLVVDNHDVAELTTDSEGAADLSLGARLSTTGNGGSYEDAYYSGTTVLRVDYWQPEVNAYVFNVQTIDIQVELDSTLTIGEEQQLHFGTLFARTSSTGQASMTIAPSGSYNLSEPENSRLVSLEKPVPGVLRVSGAASNYSLTITPQATEVLLEHSENPGAAPHFVLSNLLTSPDGTGITDENGELLIELGGTLETELTASPVTYPDGLYEGIYELTVSY